MSDIIGFEELQEKLGGRTPAEVAARLTAVGISYIRGKNGKPWTTIDAINWSPCMNLELTLSESPRKCPHCGGTGHETQLPDGWTYRLYTYTCDTCTFETNPAGQRSAAIARWNDGVDQEIVCGQHYQMYGCTKPSDPYPQYYRYKFFPRSIPVLRRTGKPLYRVFAFGLGKTVLKGIQA